MGRKCYPEPKTDNREIMREAVKLLMEGGSVDSTQLPKAMRSRVRDLLLKVAGSDPKQSQSDDISPEGVPEKFAALVSSIHFNFKSNLNRHKGVSWGEIEKSLIAAKPEKLESLKWINENGGNVDALKITERSIVFTSFSPETPQNTRNLDFFEAYQQVSQTGAQLMGKRLYFHLQKYGEFDKEGTTYLKTDGIPKKVLDAYAYHGDQKGALSYHHALQGHREEGKVVVRMGDSGSHNADFGYRCIVIIERAGSL